MMFCSSLANYSKRNAHRISPRSAGKGKKRRKSGLYPHAKTRMSSNTPSHIGTRNLLVLSTVREIASGIPFGRVIVDGRIMMDLGKVIGL